MTTVLVTGAAGFLGRWFVREHLRRGDWVVGVDNLSNPHSFWPDELPIRSRFQENVAGWFERIPDVPRWDLIYHFAAPVGGRAKIEGDPLFNAESLQLDTAFFRWAIHRAGIAIYPSSSAVYGASLQVGNGRRLSEEMFCPDQDFWPAPDEMYGTTKLVGEYLAWKSERYGLNTLCIRPFSGYGEGQSAEYPVPSILKRAKNREDPITIWGTGEQRRDFIHVSDVVGATLARLDDGIRGYQTMNIASGKATSFHEVARMASEIVGYKPQFHEDVSKPSGVSSRYGSIARMSRYYTPKVGLREGLTRVLEDL